MYVPMKGMLEDANKNYYAVPAINVMNMELVRGVINAAEEENSPLIINIGEVHMIRHGDAELLAPMIKYLAERSPVPIALNYDHGKSWERITHSFRNGFTSIMIDASAYDLEENIAITKKVVDLCHTQNVSVEAELGHVGQAANNDDKLKDLLTKPEDVVYFVEETGVDALAVSVGTAHGQYPKGYVPELHFDLIREIKKVKNMPLVLHGGSGSGMENLAKAVEAGINKVNLCSDVWVAGRDRMNAKLKENPDISLIDLLIEFEDSIKDCAKGFMRALKSSGKAKSFTWESCRETKKEIAFDITGE